MDQTNEPTVEPDQEPPTEPTTPEPEGPEYTDWQYEGTPEACSWCGALVPITKQDVHTARELASQAAIEFMDAARTDAA